MPEQQAPIAKWLIMMYIAADDVLANFAVVSLKQIKRAASPDVVVAAQFDADGRRNIPRMIFDGSGDKNGSLRENELQKIPRDTDMADPIVLRDFIDWAYSNWRAEHYALVLWGHGPELLFDDYPVPGSKQGYKKFMSPSDLAEALADTKLIRGGPDTPPRKFDVIGIDACNMCMLEAAYEIKAYTDFLVASQEEVPDFSFPYDGLLQTFGETGKEGIPDMCKQLPEVYTKAYADYIFTKDTKMESITLTSISLDHVTDISKQLAGLATELLKAIDHPQKREAIIGARANSKGFVAGLYTDLYDFCEQLRSQLCLRGICSGHLVQACKAVCDAIDAGACIIANQATVDKHCHGLSIYFPYLTDAEKSAFQSPLAPLVKGGLDVLDKGGLDVLDKNSIDLLNSGGSDVLNTVRRQRIQETEQYYYDLQLPFDTRWGEFIKYGWSRSLVENAEAQAKLFPQQEVTGILDDRYSAQQCALNMLSMYRESARDKSKQEASAPPKAKVVASQKHKSLPKSRRARGRQKPGVSSAILDLGSVKGKSPFVNGHLR